MNSKGLLDGKSILSVRKSSFTIYCGNESNNVFRIYEERNNPLYFISIYVKSLKSVMVQKHNYHYNKLDLSVIDDGTIFLSVYLQQINCTNGVIIGAVYLEIVTIILLHNDHRRELAIDGASDAIGSISKFLISNIPMGLAAITQPLLEEWCHLAVSAPLSPAFTSPKEYRTGRSKVWS